MLDATCWMLHAGCYMLDFIFKYQLVNTCQHGSKSMLDYIISCSNYVFEGTTSMRRWSSMNKCGFPKAA